MIIRKLITFLAVLLLLAATATAQTEYSGTISEPVTLTDGASITLNNATITGGIVCEGSATITLVGTNSVTGADKKAGIQIGGSGATLTIKGDGSLTANGGYWSAGIGLSAIFNYDNNVSSGDIIIEGGTITAIGGDQGAGIGTGIIKNTNNDNSTSVQFGNVTIKGGTVTATDGGSGDGIGKGYSYPGPSITFGIVTIYDGINMVDASSIKNSESIVYMHDETDVTANASNYFTITEDGDRRIIAPKDDADYTITIADDIEHGTLTGAATAKYMEKVTITATPDLGYRLSRLVVKDADNNDVATTGNSFFMPKGEVTVSAVFEQGVHGTTEFVLGYFAPDGYEKEATIYDGVTTVNLQSGISYSIGKDYYEYVHGEYHIVNIESSFLLDNNIYSVDIPYAGGTGEFVGVPDTKFNLNSNGESGYYDITMTDAGNDKWSVSILKTVGVIDNIPDQTYTGSEITPEPLVMAGSLNLTKGTDYEYSYTDNVNVGTAKVTVTFKGDYASLGSVEKEFNIVRATPTVTAPTANTLTYNGNEQELVTAGSTDFGKVLYSLDGTNYSKDIPKATDAGTYTVYYKVDTDNYFYAPQTVEVTIAEESKTEPITTQISYVTANGQASEEVTAIVLDENTVIDEDFDWSQPVYYVTGDVVYSDAYFMFSNPNGVTLILADDANLNVGTIMTYHPYEDGSTEYGTYDVIITKAVGAEGVGKISSQIICKNFVQYAGQLTGIVGAFGDSTGEDADYQGTITLDFADESASANIVTYYEEMRLCDSFIIPDGKALTDGTNIYTGTLSADDLTAISGQTLRPCLVLADDIIGDETLANNDGMTLTVALANRTIDTEWNTIALPFDVSAEQLTETFGTGVKLYELSGSTLDNGVLGLEFASATSIEAGKPYFIKASADVVNPTFQSVTIDASANNPSATDYVDFIPTLGVTTVEGSDLREVLVLGAGNTLYNPSVLPAMMKGFRGFFRVHDEVVANAAQFRMSFAEESEISGIFRVAGDNGTDGCIYNLMGQRVNRADKGLFIVNGKRVIRP